MKNILKLLAIAVKKFKSLDFVYQLLVLICLIFFPFVVIIVLSLLIAILFFVDNPYSFVKGGRNE